MRGSFSETFVLFRKLLCEHLFLTFIISDKNTKIQFFKNNFFTTQESGNYISELPPWSVFVSNIFKSITIENQVEIINVITYFLFVFLRYVVHITTYSETKTKPEKWATCAWTDFHSKFFVNKILLLITVLWHPRRN